MYPWVLLCLITLKAFCQTWSLCCKRGLFIGKKPDAVVVHTRYIYYNWKDRRTRVIQTACTVQYSSRSCCTCETNQLTYNYI